LGYAGRRIGAAKADDGTLTLSAVVRVWIIIAGIVFLPQRAGRHPGEGEVAAD